MNRWLTMSLLLLAASPAWSATTAEADRAYAEAREARTKLKGDEKQRKFRHAWLNVGKKFDRVASGFARSERAPEALYTAGELYSELSRFSQNQEDVDSARARFEKVLDAFPKHRLADDAAYALARILAEREGDPAAARRIAAAAVASGAGDKEDELRALLKALPAETKKAERGEKQPHPAAAVTADKARAERGAEERGSKARADAQRDGDRKARPAAQRDDDHKARADAQRDDDRKARADAQRDDDRKARPAAQRGDDRKARAEAQRDDERKATAEALRDDERKPRGDAERDDDDATGDDDRRARAADAQRDGDRKPTADERPVSASAKQPPAHAEASGSAKRGPAPRPADEAEQPPAANPVANAIARLNAATAKLRDDDEGARPSAQGRAGKVLRPLPRDEASLEGDEASSGEEVADGPALPTLDAIREKLRDVRVGERQGKPTLADARLLKLRMEQSDKQQGGEAITLAEQLGLKVRRVVIDAGHGGHDTGAIGPSGVLEKDASLAMALALKDKLEAAGLEVLLTRDDDTFVKLEDRSRIANRAHGDLFISIHCNAAPSPKMRGIETYTLNVASNRYAVRLAARENASSEKGMGDLQYILADLTTKANTDESRRLAAQVQGHLVGSLSAKHKGVRDLGTKEALFYVLLGAKMPAILVETSFVSNPEEEKLLSEKGYQNDVAQAVTDAVKDFLKLRDRVARVD